MKKIFLFLLIHFSVILAASAQNVTSTENFIAYKFPRQVDSLLVLTLDSFNQEFVQNVYIILDIRQSISEDEDAISLHFSKDLKSDTSLGGTLAKNTNCYFVSLSRKYKIPIIFNEDEILRSQYKQYELMLFEDSGCHLLYIYLKEDKITSILRNWSVSDVLNRKKYIITTSPLK